MGMFALTREWIGAFKAATFGLAFSALATAALAIEEPNSGPPMRIVIGLDLSKSNPLVDDSEYAKKAAEAVAAEIRELPYKSKVMIRTFGSYKAGANSLRIDRTISTTQRPDDLGNFVETLISGIPMLVKRGTIRSQNKTNIIAFMENVGQLVDCDSLDTLVILISDGVEDSEYARLATPGSSLPRPQSRDFEGCSELRMLGVGQSLGSPSETKRIRDEWERWSRAAGFEDFTGLNDW